MSPTPNERWKPTSDEEDAQHKFMRKARDEPFIPIGFVGLTGALIYGAYAYKNRGPMSTSRYLMRLRVVAQSMVVGAIMVGVVMSGGLSHGTLKKELDHKPR